MSTTIRTVLLGSWRLRALDRRHSARGVHDAAAQRQRRPHPARDPVHGQRDGRPDREAGMLYAPTGYTATLTQPAGTTLGTVTAQGTAADLGGALLPLTGTVQARPRTARTPPRLGASRHRSRPPRPCAPVQPRTARSWGPDPAGGRPDAERRSSSTPPSAGAANTSAFAPRRSRPACRRRTPTGTPGRASFGFKLTQVDFKVNNVFTSPGSSLLRWRVLATPYTPNTGRANPAGSVEAQSVVAFPRVVSLRKPRVKVSKGTATVTIAGAAQLPAGVATTPGSTARGPPPG